MQRLYVANSRGHLFAQTEGRASKHILSAQPILLWVHRLIEAHAGRSSLLWCGEAAIYGQVRSHHNSNNKVVRVPWQETKKGAHITVSHSWYPTLSYFRTSFCGTWGAFGHYATSSPTPNIPLYPKSLYSKNNWQKQALIVLSNNLLSSRYPASNLRRKR